ncbi:hypothetical protein ACHAXR_003980 [Thalassiosira sp. AJA248-18]
MVKFKTFDEMIANHRDTPLLIDFYAPWCGPCKMMKGELGSIRPQLEKLGPIKVIPNDDDKNENNDNDTLRAEDEDGNVDNDSGDCDDAVQHQPRPTGIPVYHVNTNKFPQVGARNNIHGLPTLVLFYEGKEIWRNEGIILGEDIVKTLTSLQEEEGCFLENEKEKEVEDKILVDEI